MKVHGCLDRVVTGVSLGMELCLFQRCVDEDCTLAFLLYVDDS